MRFSTPFGTVALVNEVTYSFGSRDNVRAYPLEWNREHPHRPTSAHGVLLNDAPLAVLGARGGATAVHDRSAVWFDDRLLLAVGDSIFCMGIVPLEKRWRLQIDPATCFGICVEASRRALVSHGEVSIARFSSDGEVLWTQGGRDIFSEGFSLQRDWIEATDFDGQVYRFDYDTGAVRLLT